MITIAKNAKISCKHLELVHYGLVLRDDTIEVENSNTR